MKKSTAVRLTLVSALAAGAVGCADERPEQAMRGWCDPENPDVCDDQPRTGFIPMFFPIYHRGIYYDNRGIGRTGPGGAVVANAPRPTVSRGGFGRVGAGRSSGIGRGGS